MGNGMDQGCGELSVFTLYTSVLFAFLKIKSMYYFAINILIKMAPWNKSDSYYFL